MSNLLYCLQQTGGCAAEVQTQTQTSATKLCAMEYVVYLAPDSWLLQSGTGLTNDNVANLHSTVSGNELEMCTVISALLN